MYNQSRLGSNEEYSSYKANKHLEKAASLLNQQSFGVRDMQEAHEFGLGGFFKRDPRIRPEQRIEKFESPSG